MGRGGGGGGRGGGGGGGRGLSGDYKVSIDRRGRVKVEGYITGYSGPGVRASPRGTSPSASQLREARKLVRAAEKRIITESAITNLMRTGRLVRGDAINILHARVAEDVARQMNRR